MVRTAWLVLLVSWSGLRPARAQQDSVQADTSTGLLLSLPPAHLGLPDLAAYRPFDGIDFHRYARFWERWALITVRFRADNGEQRFIYANQIAWQAMRSGRHGFPDGAMFGKVAFAVADDPSFPNSREPRQFTRIQLMRKDSSGHRATGGWEYALIVAGSGVPYREERPTVAACRACHSLVPERDYVFSSPAFMGDGHAPSALESVAFKDLFKDQDVSSLSAFQNGALARVLSSEGLRAVRRIRAFSMDLFSGSINESIGPLSRFASEANTVYALWDEAHAQFVVAAPLPSSVRCRARARLAMTIGRTHRPAPHAVQGLEDHPSSLVSLGTVCDGVLERQ